MEDKLTKSGRTPSTTAAKTPAAPAPTAPKAPSSRPTAAPSKAAAPSKTVEPSKAVAPSKAAAPSKAVAPAGAPVGADAPERGELVRLAAYFRAEARGFAPGYDVEDWLAAEAEVTAKIGPPASPAQRKAPPRKPGAG